MSALRTESRTLVFAALLAAFAAGCTPINSTAPADPAAQREQAAVGDLKSRYKDVVTGTDVQKQTLIVYVDVDNMYSMDEDSEAAMKSQALAEWKHVWSAAHPGKHAKLQLSLRDYYGKEIYSATTRS
jgi:hypothetical protein